MRRYTGDDEKKLEQVICNRCGKEIQVVNEIVREGVLTIQKEWDFFSEKDGMIHKFDLCEECYDEWIRGFKVPVEEDEKTEMLCFETYPCDNK